jgi:hypothetical protein
LHLQASLGKPGEAFCLVAGDYGAIDKVGVDSAQQNPEGGLMQMLVTRAAGFTI